MSESHLLPITGIVVLFLLILYGAAGLFIEKTKLIVGHESGIVLIIGAGISLLFFMSDKKEFNELMHFNDNLFFYVCLPPIIISSAYNMKRKMFFSNINLIMIFGLVSTIYQFILFSLSTYLLV